MSIATKTNLRLEILISTMNRNSLDFLEKLFPNSSFKNFNLLIINQTTKTCVLVSKYANVRVINSFAKGLTNSRNLALENAKGSICLIADDDVIYHPNFDDIIIKSFDTHTEADVITFKMKDLEGKDFKTYENSKWHDLKSLKQVNSVTVAFKLEKIKASNVQFNPNFGLGSTFETADEYIFLRDCLKADLKLWFQSQYLLSHDRDSSGRAKGSNRLVFARGALFYKYYGCKGYLKLIHYLLLEKKKGFIANEEILQKFKIGLNGISVYKKLLKIGEEKQ